MTPMPLQRRQRRGEQERAADGLGGRRELVFQRPVGEQGLHRPLLHVLLSPLERTSASTRTQRTHARARAHTHATLSVVKKYRQPRQTAFVWERKGACGLKGGMKEGKVNKARPVLLPLHVYSKRVDRTSLCPRSIQTCNRFGSHRAIQHAQYAVYRLQARL